MFKEWKAYKSIRIILAYQTNGCDTWSFNLKNSVDVQVPKRNFISKISHPKYSEPQNTARGGTLYFIQVDNFKLSICTLP